MTEVGIDEVGTGEVRDDPTRGRVEVARPAPHTLLVTVRGDLDDRTLTQLRTVLNEHGGLDEHGGPDHGGADGQPGPARSSRVVLDLSRVTLLSSDAVELLRLLRRRCPADHRHLVLVGAGRPAVHRPLRTSGMLPLFDTRATLRSALPEPVRVRRVR